MSVRARELSAIFELLYEARHGIGQAIQLNHEDSVLPEVNLIDQPIGTKEMMHHIQGRDLAKLHELVLDQG